MDGKTTLAFVAAATFELIDNFVQTRAVSATSITTRLAPRLAGVATDRADRQQQPKAKSQSSLHGVPQGEGVSESE